jgi:hypothetical protein
MAVGWGGAMVPTGESSSSGMGLNLSQNQATNQAQNNATNNSFNNAYSTSFIPDYSQTAILERIAQEAENYAPQVYNWGIDAYERNQHSIDDLMRAGQMWASPQHIATMMGQAEAGVQQAGEQARQKSIQDLQSFGIDPSAGRYKALNDAIDVQTAATAAGAGNQQRNADIDRGVTMQNQAMSAGMQNTQIGYGAANAMNSLYGTGMQLKYSPLGQTSTSTGGSSGVSSGSSSGQSTGESFGMNQQTSQSQQQQPVNVIQNKGIMVRRGGYVGHDHIEHPDGEIQGYDFGGPVSSAPMSFPNRPFMNPSTPMPMPGATRSEMSDIFSSDPQARFGGMENFDTKVQSGLRNLPPGLAGQAEGIYGRVRGVMPRMLGFAGGGGRRLARGGMVMDDPIAREIEEKAGQSPEEINRQRSYETGDVGEESEGYQEGGEVDDGYTGNGDGGVTNTPIDYDNRFQMAGDYGLPGGPQREDYPVTPETELTPGGQKRPDTSDDRKQKNAQPPTGTQTAPPDQTLKPTPTPDQTKPSPDREPLPTQPGAQGPRQIPEPQDFKPGDKTPSGGIVQPDGGIKWPDGTVAPPAGKPIYRGPGPGDQPQVVRPASPAPSGPIRPDPTTKQWPPANVPPDRPYEGDPRFRYAPKPGEDPSQRRRQQTDVSPDAAPGGRYRAYNPISLVAGRPTGANFQDPMTGEWLTLQPGEFGQEDASITGKFGRRLGYQTQHGAAAMLAAELDEQRRRRGYAGGGVVGTTTAGFTPSGPVGGAPISPGAPSFTSGMPRGMARGGSVAPTTGGFVSQALSPSRGGQVDDVPARLNEGEYVIPRDVVQFKGKEFFHKLILQSRKNREAHQQSYFGGARG